MKTKTTLIAVTISMFAGILLMVELSPKAGANNTGAPAGTTGSPGDGVNCTTSGCHVGTASTQAGLITSNIPGTGYIAGQTYTITASITTAGRTKFGFQVSAQNTSGTKLGTIVLTNTTGTQLLSGGKYITHKLAGTSFPSETATWSFDWTAPAAGTGDVTFYGAFNSTNSNNTTSGDIITLSTLTVSESITSGINAVWAYSNKVTAYPNPFTDNITLKNEAAANDKMQVSIIDITGKTVKTLSDVSNNQTLDLSELAKGYYVCRIETANGIAIKKLTKN